MTTEEKQPDVPLTEGEILAGKYRVERILGRGGMGVVVAAQHIHLRQRVAIKFLLPDATGEVVARFLREARAAVRLKSEHVTRVLDVGELPGGAPFMVMEYLEGSDLSRVVRKRGALPIEEAVDYLLQACEAIAEAHSLGIVHRDLKPANLFLTKGADGSDIVKVLDFGISKDTGAGAEAEEEMQLTRTTAVLGSPYYMAPEQMRSTRSVDARADIWSLGIILYQLLTKKVPFKADSFVELALMVVNEEAKPPTSLRPEIPPGLEEAIQKTMRKKPDERFANVAEFAAALAPFGRSTAIASAERIARVQGAPIPSIAHVERHSSVSVPPPPASTTQPPHSVASGSGSSVGSAVLSSGPSIPGVAQATQPSPTAMPTLPPPTTGSASSPNATSATGAAWTGAAPTMQARRTGALIIGAGFAVGAVAVIGLVAFMRGRGDSGQAHVAAAATPEVQQVAPVPTAPTAVVSPVISAAPVSPPPTTAAPSAVPVAPVKVPVPSPTARPTATAQAVAPPPVTVAPAPPPPPPPVTAAPAPPPPPVTAAPAPAPTPKKNVLDIDIK